MDRDEKFSITSISKRKVPDLPFLDVKNQILGQDYELSLVSVPKKTAQELNILYRQKDYIPNILSFPYTKKSGEIFINLEIIKKQHNDFDMNFETYLVFLFIHGCLHLKGMEHSSTMESKEKKLLQKLYLDKLPK